VKIVFDTNATFIGNLTATAGTNGATYTQTASGVAGGNADCQAEAAAAGLPGTYKAWLSDSLGNSPAATFSQSTVPYVTPDPGFTQVASNWTQLTSGTLSAGIDYTAGGNFIEEGNYVWTGSNANGTPSTNNCNNWTSTSNNDIGDQGNITDTGSTWSLSGNEPCGGDILDHLVCVQQ
jgi:hypothetical protein